MKYHFLSSNQGDKEKGGKQRVAEKKIYGEFLVRKRKKKSGREFSGKK